MSSGCRVALLLLCGTTWGCAATSGPPRGPEYTPVATPDAQTRCGAEQTQAKLAREQLLTAENLPEEGGNPVSAREAAAKATLAQGECEARLVLSRPIQGARAELYLADLTAARDQLAIARNLYEESARYGMPPWNVAAMARLGEVLAAFATAAEKGRPNDISADDLAAPIEAVRGDARIAFEHAVRLGRGAPPGSEIATERDRACTGLRALLPGARCDAP